MNEIQRYLAEEIAIDARTGTSRVSKRCGVYG